MFTDEKTRDEIRDTIEDAIDKMIAGYRQKYYMGDNYTPMALKEHDAIQKTLDTLTGLIADSLQHEYIFERDTEIIDIYESDAERVRAICEKNDLFERSLIEILLNAYDAGDIDITKYM